jgi:hypothetical protein
MTKKLPRKKNKIKREKREETKRNSSRKIFTQKDDDDDSDSESENVLFMDFEKDEEDDE